MAPRFRELTACAGGWLYARRLVLLLRVRVWPGTALSAGK